MTTTERLLAMWEMGRTRLTRLLDQVSDEKLPRRMHPESSSAAFLLRHMGEVDRLFARNISHTAYHAGQLALILKYAPPGSNPRGVGFQRA